MHLKVLLMLIMYSQVSHHLMIRPKSHVAVEPGALPASMKWTIVPHYDRRKRSAADTFLELWRGLIGLAGFQVTWSAEEYLYETEATDNVKKIEGLQRYFDKQQDRLQRIRDKHMDKMNHLTRNEVRHQRKILKQHEADLKLILGTLENPEEAIDELCGDTACREFIFQHVIRDHLEANDSIEEKVDE